MADITLLAKAINDLSLSLYVHMAQDDGNVFFSPFSISTALSMLLCGARGHTEQEMRKALHFENVNISSCEVHQLFDELLTVFSKSSEKIILTFANAILSQKDMPVSSEFKEAVQKTYRALCSEVDFCGENEKAVAEVNEWVKKNTNDMIQKMLESLHPATVMVILNAIYFKGSWKCPFDQKNTRPRIFYNNGKRNEGTKVPMMFISKRFGYVEKETYKALELPYEGDSMVMILLLPKELNGLQNLESSLTVEVLKDTMNSLRQCKVDVIIPKFRIEYSKELSKTLIKLGMVSAFQGSADFSGINPGPLCVSEVRTKSVLVVNEEGTEAAAATAVMLVRCAMVFKEEFQADHPFMCVIYDIEKEMILFIGRVVEL